MSDRKYRQRGYQDQPTEREPKGPKKPAEPRAPGRQLQDAAGPRTPNLMESHEVFRCTRCGNLLGLEVSPADRCSRCGVDIHSCINCVSFDAGSRWECARPELTARVAPKDERNECSLFRPRATVERQTSTSKTGPPSARQAFDDLFK